LIEIGSNTAEKNSAQTNRQTNKQTNRHYENNGHLAVNQFLESLGESMPTLKIGVHLEKLRARVWGPIMAMCICIWVVRAKKIGAIYLAVHFCRLKLQQTTHTQL